MQQYTNRNRWLLPSLDGRMKPHLFALNRPAPNEDPTLALRRLVDAIERWIRSSIESEEYLKVDRELDAAINAARLTLASRGTS